MRANITIYHTEILEVNLFAFAYRLFHEDFSSNYGALNYSNAQKLPTQKLPI